MGRMRKGERTLQIDGKDYIFVLDLSAMATLEEMFSTPGNEVSFNEIVNRFQKGGQIRYARAIVWSLMQHHHPEITLEQAGRLFTIDVMSSINDVFKDMVDAASPDPADARELGIDRPHKARVNGRGAGRTTGATSKSKHASLA
jgi:hypothetical protein